MRSAPFTIFLVSMRLQHAAALSVLLGVAEGCAVWAVPPIQTSFGGALINSEPHPDRPALDFSAGIYPLQALDDFARRTFDFGAGYGAFAGPRSSKNVVHGPYLEAGLFLGSVELDPDWRLRLSVATQARWLLAKDTEAGNGAALRIATDLSRSLSGAYAACPSFVEPCSAAAAQGEGGIGLYVELAYSSLDRHQNISAGLGLILRIPTSAGAVLMSPGYFIYGLLGALFR